MRYIYSQESLEIPEGGTYAPAWNCAREAAVEELYIGGIRRKLRRTEGIVQDGTPSRRHTNSARLTVKVHIKTRQVTVEGPRGKLTKDLGHLAVAFSHPEKNKINIELHHGSRKNVATLRTVRTLINNLIIGVTKGFKYKMRYVYAHFPINVNLDQDKETGLWEVEIRSVVGNTIHGWK
jgi:hypothetical protein